MIQGRDVFADVPPPPEYLMESWSVAVWSLFVLACACWLPVLALQVLLRREAERAAMEAALLARFHQFKGAIH